MPTFDIGAQSLAPGQGLLMGLDPGYQAKQQQIQQNALALRQAQLFADGLPQDGRGTTDWNAAYDKAMRAGAYDLAGNLVSTGIRMSALNDHSTLDNPLGGRAGGGLLAGLGGSTSGFVPAAGVSNSRGGNAAKGANPDVVSYIRSAFTARGVNPNVALGVAGAEGLRGFDPAGNANPGDDGSSFGPFQLHMGGLAGGANRVAGLGDDFAKATGLDPRDPSTWKQQVDFVADHVAQHGWGAFHGAKAAGIGEWAGIGNQPQGQAAGIGTPAPQGGGQGPLTSFGPTAAPDPAAAARARLAAQNDVDLDTLVT